MYNPFAGIALSGTWEDHAGYSAGGSDIPLGWGTPIPAPASGILRISGGSGEWACGWVGSAGRRSILTLDTPLPRLAARRTSPPEGEGPLVAIVLQHQSAFGNAGWHPETDIIGTSGDSAYSEHDGTDHLHWHGLNAAGQRLRLESFITGSSPAGGAGSPITNEEEQDMGFQIVIQEPPTGQLGRTLFISPTIVTHVVHDDVVAVNNYVGVQGGGTQQQVSEDDARRLVECRGFDWAKVDALQAGQGVTLDGKVINAGAAVW